MFFIASILLYFPPELYSAVLTTSEHVRWNQKLKSNLDLPSVKSKGFFCRSNRCRFLFHTVMHFNHLLKQASLSEPMKSKHVLPAFHPLFATHQKIAITPSTAITSILSHSCDIPQIIWTWIWTLLSYVKYSMAMARMMGGIKMSCDDCRAQHRIFWIRIDEDNASVILQTEGWLNLWGLLDIIL